jgi:hypothetical protein
VSEAVSDEWQQECKEGGRRPAAEPPLANSETRIISEKANVIYHYRTPVFPRVSVRSSALGRYMLQTFRPRQFQFFPTHYYLLFTICRVYYLFILGLRIQCVYMMLIIMSDLMY